MYKKLLINSVCALSAVSSLWANAGPQQSPFQEGVGDKSKQHLQTYAGYSGRKDATYGYLGALGPLGGHLDQSGFRYEVFLGLGQYKYQPVKPLGQIYKGKLSNASLRVGYELVTHDNNRFSLYAGPYYRGNIVSPKDPYNRTRGKKGGAVFTGDVYITSHLPLSFEGCADVGTVYKEVWARGRPAYNFDPAAKYPLRAGPEVVYERIRGFQEYRAGGFIAMGIQATTELALSVGQAWCKATKAPQFKATYVTAEFAYRF